MKYPIFSSNKNQWLQNFLSSIQHLGLAISAFFVYYGEIRTSDKGDTEINQN